MRSLAIAVCALCCAVPAKADTFWFAEPTSNPEAEGNAVRDCVRGVLLSEDADHYVVRVVGGELTIAKKSVVRVEKDDLTVEAIAKMEAEAAEALAQADAERRMRQAAERARADVAVADASARRAERDAGPAQPATVQPSAPVPGYDPVLRAMRLGVGKQQLVREATLAFERTGDRDLRRLMRQLRRM